LKVIQITFFNILENDKNFKILEQIRLNEIENHNQLEKQFLIIKEKELNKDFIMLKENFINLDEEKLDLITCGFCGNIVNHPICQCGYCGKLFCEKCLNKQNQEKSSCNKCNTIQFIKNDISPELEEFIRDLNFTCPLKCGETFDFIEFKLHKDLCKNLKDIYQCSLCEKIFEYHDDLKKSHANHCEKLQNCCIYCNKEIPFFDFEYHLKTCEELIEYCGKCNLMICRKYQDAHKNLFCSTIEKLSLSINKLEENIE